MITIAITGGIGSGKTAATDYLEKLGYKVIDADKVAHSITAPCGKAIPKIRKLFGDEYIAADGSMDRSKMRALVYNNSEAKRLLEECTTAVVIDDIESMREEESMAGRDVLFIAAPLLFEQNMQNQYDQVWVVTCDMDTRIKRIGKRDSLDEAAIKNIISNQMSDDVKVNLADEVIDNSGTIDELHDKIDRMLQKLSN